MILLFGHSRRRQRNHHVGCCWRRCSSAPQGCGPEKLSELARRAKEQMQRTNSGASSFSRLSIHHRREEIESHRRRNRCSQTGERTSSCCCYEYLQSLYRSAAASSQQPAPSSQPKRQSSKAAFFLLLFDFPLSCTSPFSIFMLALLLTGIRAHSTHSILGPLCDCVTPAF